MIVAFIDHAGDAGLAGSPAAARTNATAAKPRVAAKTIYFMTNPSNVAGHPADSSENNPSRIRGHSPFFTKSQRHVLSFSSTLLGSRVARKREDVPL